jgi:hypothetical protein
LKTLDLPNNDVLPTIAMSIEAAMQTGTTTAVRMACADFLKEAARFYEVPDCGIRVLAARPLRVREQWTTELFGDYHIEEMLIRLWMRTTCGWQSKLPIRKSSSRMKPHTEFLLST